MALEQMAEKMIVDAVEVKEKKSREEFLRILSSHVVSGHIPTDARVLIIGGTVDDYEILRRAGFSDITLSNFDGSPARLTDDANGSDLPCLSLDVEQLGVADGSFEMVFAHEVVHHCRSPHRAICEMLRVARKYVLFLEPNDSAFMGALTRMGFSFPYELPGGLVAGGVRKSSVPNFIYRWNSNEVRKTAASFLAESEFSVFPYPYWDFNATEQDLELRKGTRLRLLTSTIGTTNFLSVLRCIQVVLNKMPFTRRQGNKFFCCVEKKNSLKPWLYRDRGKIFFNSRYGEPDSEENKTVHP